MKCCVDSEQLYLKHMCIQNYPKLAQKH